MQYVQWVRGEHADHGLDGERRQHRLARRARAGVRVAGVENTATARAAQASLKTTTMTLVKTADELFDLLKSGRADAIALSRESLSQLAAKLPGSRVLDGAYLNSYVAVAVPTMQGRSP